MMKVFYAAACISLCLLIESVIYFACPSILELTYLIFKPEILSVWTMHEEEVKDLADQALKADKIITEQLFGWKWKAPDIHALQQVIS